MDYQKSNPLKYKLNEPIYESSDKTIKIFKSRKRQTIQYIAIKVYNKKAHPDNYEYNILKNLNHPHIIRILGYSEDYNYFYMEEEYCITGDLSRCLWQNKNSRYNEKVLKCISTQLLLALQYLHKNGYIHCNLKPSNILIDEYGNIRLCDFKKVLKISTMKEIEIRKNKSAMTPCYTAPELFSDDGVYSVKTDLWALGCIMYELAVGQVPFFDESVGKLISKIINDDVNFNRKELCNFSDELLDILRKLLEKDPALRISWGEVERHPFWELYHNENINTANSENSSRKSSAKSLVKVTERKADKKVDILRLSRNALKNMKDDHADEYSYAKENEVDNADQEFNFQGEGEVNDEKENYPNQEVKLKNPLEVSVLNVSRVIKRDKRRNNQVSETDKSIFRNDEIPSVDQLKVHQTDKIIKPIIGNKLIEVVPQTTFKRDKLPFQPWKVEKIKEVCAANNTKAMENFLLNIYSCMDQFENKGDDDNLLNVLNYFEVIIQDKEIANNIINTSFINLFILYLQKLRNDNLRIRLCGIIAYLIRYSTVIETPLDELGLSKVLIPLVADKNVEVSKKAMATLGEYLFFVATQAEGEDDSTPSGGVWDISQDSLDAMLYAVDMSRDDVVKFYAVKSIENITALTQISKKYFTANGLFLVRILEIFKFSKNQELRTSAIYTISHLIRLEPKLLRVFLEKFALEDILTCLDSENPKNQQAIINCILFGLENNRGILMNNPQFYDFFVFLVNLLDYSNVVIRIKIILIVTFTLLDVTTIGNFGERIFHILIKLRKENNSELHTAIKYFENSFKLTIKNIIRNFISIPLKSSRGRNNSITSNLSNDEHFAYLNAFLVISTYTKVAKVLYTAELMETLVRMIEFNSEKSILKNVFEILKNFSENSSCVNEHNDIILKRLIIPILKSTFSLSIENKILPLNIAANMITILLDDEKLYSSTVIDEGKTKLINSLIIQILPLLREMLKSEDVVLAALSFLSLIIERNSAFIRFYKSEGIIDYVLQIVDDMNFCSNLNLIKILIKLIQSPETSFEEIITLNLIDKVNYLISNDGGDNGIYTEYVIELFYDLMFKINEQKKQNFSSNIDREEFRKFTSKIESVARNFKLCIKLIGCDNINIQEKSCVSLIFLLQLFPDTFVESCGVYVKFSSSDIPELLKGLDYNCAKIHKRMIRIFRWIIEFQADAATVLKPFVSYINTYVENIANSSNDHEVVQLANKFINYDLKSLKF